MVAGGGERTVSASLQPAFKLNMNFTKPGWYQSKLVASCHWLPAQLWSDSALKRSLAARGPALISCGTWGRIPKTIKQNKQTKPNTGTLGSQRWFKTRVGGYLASPRLVFEPGQNMVLWGTPLIIKNYRGKCNPCQTMCAYRGDILLTFLMK